MLDYHLRSNPTLAYRFIIGNNKVLAHSFTQGVPVDLISANLITKEGLIFIKKVTRPLMVLAETAEKIDEGHLDQKVDIPVYREMGIPPCKFYSIQMKNILQPGNFYASATIKIQSKNL